MTLDEFVAAFADEFDETPIEFFTPDTVFSELEEWSSLTALSIISMVDEQLDKILTGADIRSSVTIRDIYELLEKK